jgi:hypothetical protein
VPILSEARRLVSLMNPIVDLVPHSDRPSNAGF